MVTFDVNGKSGSYKINIPTSINEIDEKYISEVTEHIIPDANYSVIGLIYREKLSSLVISANKKKEANISVIPVFVKSGKTDSSFVNSINLKDKVIIAPSDIMMGYHLSTPNNYLTINTILDIVYEDANLYNKLLGVHEYGHFIEFKLVPNCNIHGKYEQPKVAEFVSPFVIKTSDTPKTSNIILPDNKIITEL